MKRIRMLTGNGIITSDGHLWKKQRQLMQPAFHRDVISGLTDTIVNSNSSLLKNWEHAARNGQSVNVTRDIDIMILETVLVSIFGEDYPKVAPEFKILAENRRVISNLQRRSGPCGRLSRASQLKGGQKTQWGRIFLGCSWRSVIEIVIRRCHLRNWSLKS